MPLWRQASASAVSAPSQQKLHNAGTVLEGLQEREDFLTMLPNRLTYLWRRHSYTLCTMEGDGGPYSCHENTSPTQALQS
jgi:hypothetical protein